MNMADLLVAYLEQMGVEYVFGIPGGAIEPLYDAQNPASVTYQVQLFAADPRAYDQSPSTATGAALAASTGGLILPFSFPVTFGGDPAGGLASGTNAGNRPTPPTLRLYGQMTNPVIGLVGTGSAIVVTGSIDAGDYLDIDVGAKTVLLNGATDERSLIDFSLSTWYELPTGDWSCQVYADSFDGSARLDVLWRNAYA